MRKAPLFVVPVDFAPEMEATVSAAFALAKKCGAHVHLLEVVPPRGPSLLDDRADFRLGEPSNVQARLVPTGRLDTCSRAWGHTRTNCRVSRRRDQDHRVVCAAHEGEAARHR